MHVIRIRVYTSVYVYGGVWIMKLFVTRRDYLVSATHVLWNYTLNMFMDMLDYRMMTEVFLFLSVFDKWKSGKVIVVISPRMWLLLSGFEDPDWCVNVCVCV
jgi:hypothetical protein